MFSPGTRKSNYGSARKDQKTIETSDNTAKKSTLTANDSPKTPLQDSNVIPNRPFTGTPAPWAARLSVLARYLL